MEDAEMKAAFEALEESYMDIHRTGYRRMPREMYLNWLFRVRGDTTRQPHYFEIPQPFKEYGYDVLYATAGDGSNYEFYDQDTLARMGTVEVNRLTGKIHRFVEYDPSEEMPDEVISRMYDPAMGRWWQPDPMSEAREWVSPYNFVQNNPVNRVDPTGALDDHYINNDGSIQTVKTDDNFDRFYVQNDASETGYRLAGQLDKNDAGLVQFPASGTGFNRYGTSDAGGSSTSPAETVGQGDHYLQPETAAVLFGLVNKLNTDFGFNISLGDMSSSNGSDPWQPSSDPTMPNKHHSGHGHFGNRSGLDVDFRYLNTEGISFQSRKATTNSSFSSANNQAIYDIGRRFGFTKNYQGTSGNLLNVLKVGGHNDHGHLGLQYKSLDWKYVIVAPTRQSGSGFNWLRR